MEIFNKSFTEQAVFAGLSSNILFPSRYQLIVIEDKGSLAKSLDAYLSVDNQSIYDAKQRTDLWYRYGKPVRVVARAVYFVAVSTLISPVGAAVHFSKSFAHSAKLITWDLGKLAITKDATSLKEDWNGVKKHLAYGSVDLVAATAGYTTVACCAFVVAVVAQISVFGVTLSATQLGLFGVATILASATGLSAISLFPSYIPQIIGFNNDRSGMYQSIEMKNQLGITGRNGRLLSHGPEDDLVVGAGRSAIPKTFELALNTELAFLQKLREIMDFQDQIYPGYSAEKDKYRIGPFMHYRADEMDVKKDVIAKLEKMLQENKGLSVAQQTKTRRLMAEIKDLEIKQQKAFGILNGSLRAKFKYPFNIFTEIFWCFMTAGIVPPNIKTPRWIHSLTNQDIYNSIGVGYYFTRPPRTNGASILNGNQEFQRFVDAENIGPADVVDPKFLKINDYKAFKGRVLGKQDPQKLLELKVGYTIQELNLAYRKWCVILHPDKHMGSVEQKVEADKLFKILAEANRILQSGAVVS
jgi:hypothetical protein